MLTASPACYKIIKDFESCKLAAYPDPLTKADPWTIGWGATGKTIVKGLVWTQTQADARLIADVKVREAELNRLLGDSPTTKNQFDALLSFGFNVGIFDVVRRDGTRKTKLQGSTLLKLHRAVRYAGAAEQFAAWINKGTSVENGLRRRRAAEAALYRGLA